MNLKQILALFLFSSVFISCEKKSEEEKARCELYI